LISTSKTDDRMKVILGNPTIISAFKSGIPGNGKPFPDGSKIAKVQWKPKKSTEAPFVVDVPDTLADLFFMEKDSKRFPQTGGWGYAQFDYDPASGTFTADKAGTPHVRRRVSCESEGKGLRLPPLSEAVTRRAGRHTRQAPGRPCVSLLPAATTSGTRSRSSSRRRRSSAR